MGVALVVVWECVGERRRGEGGLVSIFDFSEGLSDSSSSCGDYGMEWCLVELLLTYNGVLLSQL